MKLSKLIKKLEKIKHKYGDIELTSPIDVSIKCPKTNPSVWIRPIVTKEIFW